MDHAIYYAINRVYSSNLSKEKKSMLGLKHYLSTKEAIGVVDAMREVRLEVLAL